jgi:hypothetical protein
MFYKSDIFKSLEYSRKISIFFNNNIIIFFKFSFNYKNIFFDFVNKVKTLSSKFNLVFYLNPDFNVYKSVYFFQDFGLKFFLSSQKNVFFSHVFLDKFFKSVLKNQKFFFQKKRRDGFVYEEFYNINFDKINSNYKNFWFVDFKLDLDNNFLYFWKNVFSKYFFLKSQKMIPLKFFSLNFFYILSKFIFSNNKNNKYKNKIKMDDFFFLSPFYQKYIYFCKIFKEKFFIFFWLNYFFFDSFFERIFLNYFFFRFLFFFKYFSIFFFFKFFFWLNKKKNSYSFFFFYFKEFFISNVFFFFYKRKKDLNSVDNKKVRKPLLNIFYLKLIKYFSSFFVVKRDISHFTFRSFILKHGIYYFKKLFFKLRFFLFFYHKRRNLFLENFKIKFFYFKIKRFLVLFKRVFSNLNLKKFLNKIFFISLNFIFFFKLPFFFFFFYRFFFFNNLKKKFYLFLNKLKFKFVYKFNFFFLRTSSIIKKFYLKFFEIIYLNFFKLFLNLKKKINYFKYYFLNLKNIFFKFKKYILDNYIFKTFFYYIFKRFFFFSLFFNKNFFVKSKLDLDFFFSPLLFFRVKKQDFFFEYYNLGFKPLPLVLKLRKEKIFVNKFSSFLDVNSFSFYNGNKFLIKNFNFIFFWRKTWKFWKRFRFPKVSNFFFRFPFFFGSRFFKFFLNGESFSKKWFKKSNLSSKNTSRFFYFSPFFLFVVFKFNNYKYSFFDAKFFNIRHKFFFSVHSLFAFSPILRFFKDRNFFHKIFYKSLYKFFNVNFSGKNLKRYIFFPFSKKISLSEKPNFLKRKKILNNMDFFNISSKVFKNGNLFFRPKLSFKFFPDNLFFKSVGISSSFKRRVFFSNYGFYNKIFFSKSIDKFFFLKTQYFFFFKKSFLLFNFLSKILKNLGDKVKDNYLALLKFDFFDVLKINTVDGLKIESKFEFLTFFFKENLKYMFFFFGKYVFSFNNFKVFNLFYFYFFSIFFRFFFEKKSIFFQYFSFFFWNYFPFICSRFLYRRFYFFSDFFLETFDSFFFSVKKKNYLNKLFYFKEFFFLSKFFFFEQLKFFFCSSNFFFFYFGFFKIKKKVYKHLIKECKFFLKKKKFKVLFKRSFFFYKVSNKKSNIRFFFFKQKGIIFFLYLYEVLLFVDDFYIWFYCFKSKLLKKRKIFNWKRVWFLKLFFFKNFSKKDFLFYSYSFCLAKRSFFSEEFNFLYNKRVIKQVGVLLKFYLLKDNTFLLFFDNVFWSLVSFNSLSKFFVFNNSFFFKKSDFFIPFFLKNSNFRFFFKLPSFTQDFPWKFS